MKMYVQILVGAILISSFMHAERYSYRNNYRRTTSYNSKQQSLSDFCRQCCKDPNPSAECKKLCGNCEMYSDEGKYGASNFPGN